ncbi:pyrroloquinoline quinone biosynthesis protein PqqF [Pseudomonas putida]|uniref:pyrroloquinoline quinone biosynthesis protein PqqF n=1 Tax=Pseudomonas putida TaxID=303 RepID=UPI0018AA3ECA|nr:pyrroloquinoline quinone biosynthesis protein PqqF [Pseudomonas putida]MBF8726298.1 pyrroloquinoline quinone biosynthesis protein PqqF [Pseudomonas putida]
MPDTIRQLTLANGLQLSLRHAPRLKRAAAALRVHAGSHDAPAKWPGLAHFLEHLFFLGTTRYPLEDGLMRYVQALGGQVNASTRERTTDFFFETPPTALAGGLMRLCQMLAEPGLAITRQRNEREVIHAEFIAWSRSRQAQAHHALLQSVAPGHPLRAFQAGNRYTLPLQAPAFQRALSEFHRRYYQGGQMVLAVSGPQSLDELEQLAVQPARLFASGTRVLQRPPPPLGTSCNRQLFAHEQMPAGAEQSLALLISCLNDSRPGMWLAAARQHCGLQAIKVETLYAFAGQLLWHIDLTPGAGMPTGQAMALLHGWFGYMQNADFAQLNREFGRLQRRREHSASAMELARRDSAGLPFTALDTQGQHAFTALLASLPRSDLGRWQLPSSEPLLHTRLPETGECSLPGGLSISNALPTARQHAALLVRWQVPLALKESLHAVLDQALAPLKARCERASVQLQFSRAGQGWELRCAGVASAVVTAIGIALPLLKAPPADCWSDCAGPPSEPMPIRALLEQLPNAVAGLDVQAVAGSRQSQRQLDRLWQQATWHGLAVGFDADAQQALSAVLQRLPGLGGAPVPVPPLTRRWYTVGGYGSEHALLVFCPLPAGMEAAGRLLAHLLQGPVYQRLRVELQLGYAVFSALRQVEGVHGLMIGVQSPHASPNMILEQVVTLLRERVTLDVPSQQLLADQFDEAVMSNAEVVEWAWQTHLATQPRTLDDVRKAILNVRQHDLERLQDALLDGQAPWTCLANAAAPPDFQAQQREIVAPDATLLS